ncbi:YeeE/YedE family protein [Luteimonas sp. MJ174]|uniref:YeeE/YedE family protein n=1 Tax=Luteimonas sp. MJ174 TaxID=3129237 RepID=UPI0031BA4D72
MKRFIAAAFASGALFGVGLALSGMTDARRILGFLDVAGDFDPTLAFVLGGAVATTLLLFRPVLRRGRPLFADDFRLSQLRHVDSRLLAGAALFGIGWGLAGYCPGPALAALGVGSSEAAWFVPAMVAGIVLQRLQEKMRWRAASHPPPA